MEYFSNDIPKNSGGLGPRFDFSSLFNHAFDLFKRSFGWQLLAMLLILIVGSVVSSLISNVFGVDQERINEQISKMSNPGPAEIMRTVWGAPGQMQSLLASTLFSCLLFPLNAAFPYLMHKANTNQTMGFNDIFIGYQKNFAQLLVLGIFNTLIMYVSLALCVLPYFLVIPLIYSSICFVLFENKAAVEALKSSLALGKAQYGTMLGFSLVAFLLAIGGVILCCIGIIATAPFFYAASYSPYVADRGVPGNL